MVICTNNIHKEINNRIRMGITIGNINDNTYYLFLMTDLSQYYSINEKVQLYKANKVSDNERIIILNSEKDLGIKT